MEAQETPMPTQFLPIPNWPFWENQGADIATADIDGDGNSDLVLLQIDHPLDGNLGFYRIGWNLTSGGGVSGGWSAWFAIPDWFPWENQGAGVAVADLDGNGQPDLIVFQIDNPIGQNAGYYRVGWNLNAAGNVTGGWGPWIAVPDWFPFENQGGAITVADLDSNGRPELVVFQVDAPPGKNEGYYRIGWNLDAGGNVSGGWSPWQAVADWRFFENQGAGIAVDDFDDNGQADLVVFSIDNPVGLNHGFYSIGWNLDGNGMASEGWGPWVEVPNWTPFENQGGGIALADLDGDGDSELIALQVDNPGGQNAALYRVLDLAPNGAAPAVQGAWRLLPFDSQILAIHAALLHSNKVLFFAGSSNNLDSFNQGDFGSALWDLETGAFTRPPTPADLFCAGHAFLANGDLLVAGGTKQYDPFHGLKDVYIFDHHHEQWHLAPFMTGGRWYPTLVTLGDGRVLALSGLGDNGEDPYEDVEICDGNVTAWTTLPQALSRKWPLYAHVFLLPDGRLFYSGGQYNTNYGETPVLVDLGANTVTVVAGLTEADHRNQSASVILPPAQDGHIMLIGGGIEFGANAGHHHHAVEATDQVSIVETLDAHPHYHHGPPLNLGRMHHNAVVLPDRTVMVGGGSAIDESRELARLNAEIYNPATNAWTLAAAARVPRLYHSVSLLLPDGRVITAGSNPARTDEELRIEVYHPPYLFKGPRPVITAVAEEITYGQAVPITTAQSASIKWVNLMRAASTTHCLDTDQRLVDVPFTQAAGVLNATIPAGADLAPPGWYMLSITNTDGVPSVAKWVHLT
jgi:hypothetical protein